MGLLRVRIHERTRIPYRPEDELTTIYQRMRSHRHAVRYEAGERYVRYSPYEAGAGLLLSQKRYPPAAAPRLSSPRTTKQKLTLTRTKYHSKGMGYRGWYAPVRRTSKGGATFERTSAPLHTTPRSLFHARGAGVLWGYFACKNAPGKVLGVKWCQATTARLRLLLDDKMSTFAQTSDYRYLVVIF